VTDLEQRLAHALEDSWLAYARLCERIGKVCDQPYPLVLEVAREIWAKEAGAKQDTPGD
jgi:hypothetical protein